ncbi:PLASMODESMATA CALLOSE-BINDING PROTEIN 3 [Solanum tuberosum]|uniref:Glucan endo-1,3-beta-glucosidase 4 n=1 Tax=Solanum tuberosum TaxID=4113 RepID=M1D3E3_SOLTU|nr:PREDICTED: PLASMODESMATA CALLOSE-BINDING PROTEIN 3 [Solanum tuberosum]
MAKPPPFHFLFLVIILLHLSILNHVKATWCVARSDASEQSLQNALDYACFSGADCAPVLENGLCYLPNTIQAHASYAFNGFYQRMNRAPGSCDFAGTATIAKTDPSYGSCVYPASPSTAGGSTTTTTPSTPGGGTGGTTNTTPIRYPPPPPGTALPLNSNGGTTPRGGPGIPDSETSNASYNKYSNLVHVAFFMLLFLHVFQLL